MNIRTLLFAVIALCAMPLHAQNDVEDVIVETYYITQANDTTDVGGGPLAIGATTYRVYLDLCADCALRAIYGDTAHPLEIRSTEVFFNHYDRGESFGHELNNGSLDDDNAALDSWLSFRAASTTRFGILKVDDPDGNSIAGAENDTDMLSNEAPEIGVPLTTADGLMTDTASTTPPVFIPPGIAVDSVFGDTARATLFLSDSINISCSTPGVKGVTAENRLLIAQLTTAGELSFHLNIVIERGDGSTIHYVATDTLLYNGETPNGLLSFPPICGCTDPNFLEYDPAAGCDDGSCATAIVFGCLDTNACNYSLTANFNIPALCCYGPDSCNGLDISVVCPDVGLADDSGVGSGFEIFPNPAHDEMNLVLDGRTDVDAVCFLLDRSGRVVREFAIEGRPGTRRTTLDLSELARGVYVLRVLADGTHYSRVVVKI